MKRIVLFINNLSSGGAEYQLCELASGLAEKDYDVTIATWGDIVDFRNYDSKVKRLRIAPGKSNFMKIVAIWRFFLAVKADWVISFGQRESKFCLLPLLLRSKRRVRVIAGERNTTIGESSKQERLMLNWLYKRANFIVPNSHAQRQHILALKPYYAYKTVTITNFTDLTVYKQTPLPLNEILRIGVFARYNTQKNCNRFVEAIRILKRKTQQQFVVEWYGNQNYKENLPNPHYVRMKEMVEEYGLQECLGLNNHIKDVVGIMPQFDAVCLPSLWEGFSNSISEAICCGKPMLVSDVADNGIMVKEGVNGFLFNPKDVSSMVNAFMKYFALNDSERLQMATNSRKRAEELFDRERYICSYIKLIES